MTGKKLVNEIADCVDESLAGLVACRPNLALIDGRRVIVISNTEDVRGRVAIVCGGGSGHEPAFGGYVGSGMLDAAVSGSVFTAPPVDDVVAAIATLGAHQPSGILVLLINYTGDRINFGLALERCKALEGITDMIACLSVGEDCALQSADRTAGRRGLAGAVLVIKIAGSMARNGCSLDEITTFLKEQIFPPNIGTIGLSLSSCTLPGRSEPSFDLKLNEVILGLGIHGEVGVKRIKLTTARQAVQTMFDHMTSQSYNLAAMSFERGQRVVVLINNLGSVTNLEMGILTNDVVKHLTQRLELTVDRIYVGTFMTSLEMSGFSITMLKESAANWDKVLTHLDSRCDAFGWSGQPTVADWKSRKRIPYPLAEKVHEDMRKGPKSGAFAKAATLEAVEFACLALKSCEKQLNKMDAGAGDGDCGTTLSTGADDLLTRIKSDPDLATYICVLLRTVANVAEKTMGGTSGAMYALMFESASVKMASAEELSISAFYEALDAGLETIIKYGGAQQGDRTMIDALHPALAALRQFKGTKYILEAFEACTEAAEKGAISTVSMEARAGRASYVNKSELEHPDPGAHAIGIIFRALYQGFKVKYKELQKGI